MSLQAEQGACRAAKHPAEPLNHRKTGPQRENQKLGTPYFSSLLDEVLYIIETSELDGPMQQSARDRIFPQLDHVTNYYVEAVTRGSLTILVFLSAAAYFVLQRTLGKTLESAWERTPTHRRLAAYLSNSSLPQDTVPLRLGPAQSSSESPVRQGERWIWLEREFSYHFLNNARFGRFRVIRLNFEEEPRNDMLVRIEFGLADEHLDLEGTFKPLLYKDYLEQFKPKPSPKKQKRGGKKRR